MWLKVSWAKHAGVFILHRKLHTVRESRDESIVIILQLLIKRERDAGVCSRNEDCARVLGEVRAGEG